MYHKIAFIPFSEFRPDAAEFDPGPLETSVNGIPYGAGLRQVQRKNIIVTSDEAEKPTGAAFHRTSEDSSEFTILPDSDDSVDPEYFIKVDPGSRKVEDDYFEAINENLADDSTYIIFVPATTEKTYRGYFVDSPQAWHATVGNTTITFRIYIPSGATGSYNVELAVGWNNAGVLTEIDTVSQTGTLETDGDDTWVEITSTVAVTSWPANPENEDLYYELNISIDEQTAGYTPPSSDKSVGSYSIVGGESTIFETLDKSAAPWTEDDSKYVETPPLENDELQNFQVDFASLLETTPRGHNVHFRYEVETSTQTYHVSLYENVSGTPTERASWSGIGSGVGSAVTDLLAVSSSEYKSITDRTKCYMEVGFTGKGADLSPQTKLPSSIKQAYNFTVFGGGSGITPVVDSNDSTGYKSDHIVSSGGNFDAFLVNLPSSLKDPGDSGDVKVRVKLSTVDFNTAWNFNLRNSGDNSKIADSGVFVQSPSSVTWFEFTLTSAQKSLVDDWGELYIRVNRKDNTHGTYFALTGPLMWDTSTSRIHEIQFVVPKTTTVAKVYSLAFRSPPNAGIRASRVSLDAPAATTGFPGDTKKLYYGTATKLFEAVDPSYEISDVSRVGGYTDEYGKSWNFASFGNSILATNWVDEIQVKNVGDSIFRNFVGFDAAGTAITDYVADGGEYPQSKYMAVIRGFLVLANINPDSYTDGDSFSVWCSQFGVPYVFRAADYSLQSAIFQVVQNSGQITQIVGGETGVLFKENSCMRVEYAGRPLIFDFPDISSSVGTPFPRSVIKGEDQLFFAGAGAFYRINRELTDIQQIGVGYVDKMFFDPMYEDLAMYDPISSDERINDAIIFGDYDPITRSVYWCYRSPNDRTLEGSRIIVYQIDTQRWSLILGEQLVDADSISIPNAATIFPGGLSLCAIVSIGNTRLSVSGILRSLVFITREKEAFLQQAGIDQGLVYTAGNAGLILLAGGDNANSIGRFSGGDTYQQFMETNTIPASFFDRRNIKAGQDVTIYGIRPVYKSESPRQEPYFQVWVQSGQMPDIEGNFVIGYGSSDEMTDEGIITIEPPVTGDMNKFGILMGGLDGPSVKEIAGFQVAYEPEGSANM